MSSDYRRPGRSILNLVRQWRIILFEMEFVETSVFTAQVQSLLTDDEYRTLQKTLIENPRATGGIRKIRTPFAARGKRGGARVIYFIVHEEQIGLLFMYAKNLQADLSPAQKKTLTLVVKQWQVKRNS
jgi:mRNA-degrading endonuclease RelE of RelBE toxin-antitoxin system